MIQISSSLSLFVLIVSLVYLMAGSLWSFSFPLNITSFKRPSLTIPAKVLLPEQLSCVLIYLILFIAFTTFEIILFIPCNTPRSKTMWKYIFLT